MAIALSHAQAFLLRCTSPQEASLWSALVQGSRSYFQLLPGRKKKGNGTNL